MLTMPHRQHKLTTMNRPGMEPCTPGVITVLETALGHARRLGHRYLGSEHLLLAVASASQPAGAILRGHGVTPERVEQEIVRQVGPGPGAGLLGGLDRDALASIGIDLDTVRASIESAFAPDALIRAGHVVQRRSRPARPYRRGPRRAQVLNWLIRRWHRRREAAMAPIPLRAASGLWSRERETTVFLPFSPTAQDSLLSIRPEARAQHSPGPGVEHVALVLCAMTDGPVPAILSSLGVPPLALRTALLSRYRQAS